jgi:hypothetical protein
MVVRRAGISDRERVLSSFRPMFGDWDYLPLIIDSLLVQSPDSVTMLVEDDDLVVMAHAYETDPGDWFLRGLRSNPDAGAFRVGIGILTCSRAMHSELLRRNARRVRYGTLDSFSESLRLSRMLGFEEDFRLWHAHHPVPDKPEETAAGVREASATDGFLDLFLSGASLSGREYYFTWWDTRRLTEKALSDAAGAGMLLEAVRDGRRTGGALLHHVAWQDMLVLSLVEGDDRSIGNLCLAAFEKGRQLGCTAVGLVHPIREEAARRQALLGLPETGAYTIQLSRPA